jgi:hypothetical protein
MTIAPPPEPVTEVVLTLNGEVQTLNVTPSTIIMLCIDGAVSNDQIERLQGLWRNASGLANRVVVLAGGARVKKVEPR